MADGRLWFRIGEACAVTLQQFDFEAGLIYVDRQSTQDGENEEPPEPRSRRQSRRAGGGPTAYGTSSDVTWTRAERSHYRLASPPRCRNTSSGTERSVPERR